MRLVALVVLVFSGLVPAAATDAAPAAGASAIEAVLRDAGLFGDWAVDCKAEASPANPHVSILLDAGSVVERHEIGTDYEINNYRVIAAKRLSPTRVSVDVLFKPGSEHEETQHLIFRIDDHTRRTIFNRIEGGPVVVSNGVVAGHKVKTPILRKCG